MTKYLNILSVFIGLIVAFLIIQILWNLITNQVYSHSDYWKYNIIDITNLLLTIFIYIFLVIILTERTNKITKRKELILDILNCMEDYSKIIYSYSLSFNTSTTKENDINIILSNFDNIDRNITILNHNSKKLLDSELKNLNKFSLKYKISVTDSPFPSKNYSPENINQIIYNYNLLCESIHSNRFKLFE